MRRIQLTANNRNSVLQEVKKTLLTDGLVVFPSDTVYGLAARADSEKAVNKLLAFKDRPRGQAISIAVKDLVHAKKYIALTKQQEQTLNMILPGAYTIVLPSLHTVSAQLEAEDKTLGIRIPDYEFLHQLSKTVPFPYTATSANIHARGPHYSIEALLNTLSDTKKNLLDLIVDYGTLPHNLPSTIVNLSESTLPTLRKGDMKLKLIERKVTVSAGQTKQLAVALLTKYLKAAHEMPVILILQGNLGAGKTVFSQGIGEYLDTEHVVSPTFVLYYEYTTNHSVITKFHHFDLYRAENQDDLENLEINKLLQPRNVLVFEWGEKIGSVQNLLKGKKAIALYCQIEILDENSRSFSIYEL
ncbi:MAG: L-threonylcarbamoyladenylate synthase [Patescibacteria group bacterium]|jgi:L-threonylcarbamoyladenylate synthase